MKYIIKRDGSKELFNPKKILNAISKAMKSVDKYDESKVHEITKKVVSQLKEPVSVEEVQDLIIKTLKKEGLKDVALAYQSYREMRALVREVVNPRLGYKDKLKLDANSLILLESRYLLKNEFGVVIETPKQMFRRVAKHVAKAESFYGGDPIAMEEEFFNIMTNLEFLPNSPTLMNAGTPLGQLSACYVLPINDSLISIFDTLKYTALIHQSGGGVGINFSNLRPKGDFVKSTSGVASGPVSFMKIFNTSTDIIKQGGKRRGANMGILNYNHPDIFEFINAKQKGGFENFNLSVSVSNSFMRKVLSGEDFYLINPRNNSKVKKVNARELFNEIVYNAWSTGDPGLIFIDEINKRHPLPEKIEATNPCGEQPLLSYESCNLGSINLSKFVENETINWHKLERVVRLAIRFLDDVIDVNKFPLKQIAEKTLSNRKIGLGVMGFADMLIKLNIPYDSKDALKLAGRLMKFIHKIARNESFLLGKERGSFPNFKKSSLKKYKYMRNATTTTIAPTGSISIIAGCSSGIEPLFAISYVREAIGRKLFFVNDYFRIYSIKHGFYSKSLMKKIAKYGSIQNLDVPKDAKELFKTALDISPEWHVRMQAEFQKYVDNAVSKTVNFPKNASLDDVANVFLLAYKLKCKGITVYRYGSKKGQVLHFCSGNLCD